MDTYFLERTVTVPYGRGEVLCYVLSDKSDIIIKCLDTADAGLVLVFVFATIGVIKTLKELFVACCLRR